MPDLTVLAWADVLATVDRVAANIAAENQRVQRHPGAFAPLADSVWGVPRGGVVPAVLLSERLGLPLADTPGPNTLIVDDLLDSGGTMRRTLAAAPGAAPAVALYRKPTAPQLGRPSLDDWPTPVDGWVVFPWEVGTDEAAGPADAVVRLLQHVGEDPSRPGLAETPRRVVKAWAEMTVGYHQDPAAILSTTFPDRSDEMVVVTGIDFVSLCEHHVLPFTGTAAVGYLPGERVVGLSKLARLVDCYARRLQVQERMTEQVATAIMEHVDARGAGVVVRAHHSCMSCRGVGKAGARMVTSSLLGSFRDDPAQRAEFLGLAQQ